MRTHIKFCLILALSGCGQKSNEVNDVQQTAQSVQSSESYSSNESENVTLQLGSQRIEEKLNQVQQGLYEQPKSQSNVAVFKAYTKRSFTPSWGWSDDNYLRVQSLRDGLVINSISINRGNCGIYGSFPMELNFGQQWDFPKDKCDVLEVLMETNEGAVSYRASY